ncbi:MAG TPA: fucose isomerase [Bryobacteraceae bacterium]
MPQPIYFIASGDLRLDANRMCWPAQQQVEAAVTAAAEKLGRHLVRAHPYDPVKQHGFIDSQRYGMQVFTKIPPDAPLMVIEAVWQYSHHVLAGLIAHKGPILTFANWSGQWPGLVGMLNLNASLTKAGVKYSTLWSENLTDEYALSGLKSWLDTGEVKHDLAHVRALDPSQLPAKAVDAAQEVTSKLLCQKAILGVFDEGCMGMYNAIIPDEILNPLGVFKERLSQSALYAAMMRVDDAEAKEVRKWLDSRGIQFRTGTDEASELTDNQILQQCKMYIAALRIADDFGCDAIGIQYQQGLKDLTPASDLVEGMLNNVDRPPVKRAGSNNGSGELYAGEALPHFNEVDECAGLDGLLTYKLWRQLGYDPENTLHDVRYGERYGDDFVWVLQISGAVPPKHFVDGWKGSVSERQVPMYFRLGGGTLKGVGKPGEIVWSRVFVEGGKLKIDMGRGKVVSLPKEEVDRRWNLTTSQWPQVNTILYGVGRDQLMARHKSNHIQLAYAPSAQDADLALAAKAAAFHALGVEVYICGRPA